MWRLVALSCLVATVWSSPVQESLVWESEKGVPHKTTAGSEPGQSWAYVTVRAKAHMFYWLYNTTHSAGYKERPLILWLQGGPGGSSTGFGNFGELGPLDTDLKPRNTTWLQTASLQFIDNPVGTGYSYVEDKSAFTTDVQGIAADLLSCMKAFVQAHPDFKEIPFYIFSESYGGKMTAAFSDVLNEAIKKSEIQMNFKGFAMGDSWISPVDSVSSWGPYLFGTSIVDNAGLEEINKAAQRVEDLVKAGEWREATNAWSSAEVTVGAVSSNVNFYNIMDWRGATMGLQDGSKSDIDLLYARHVKPLHNGDLNQLMNGPIKRKLKIIPDSVEWGGQSGDVFTYQSVDFMKDVKATVNKLINEGNLKVIIYSGQLDLICDVLGTEKWFSTMDIFPKFKAAERRAYRCPGERVCFFGKKLDNMEFYWILKAGHMVPSDNGPGALDMVNEIIEDS